MGYELYNVYVDDGYSAKDTNRPALQKMLAEIPQKNFDIIIVWNSDRLTRDVIDGLTMVKTLFNKHGVKFASITEDIDTSTPDGMMMFTMRLMMAQRERERIGERVAFGQAKKAQTGRRVSLGAIYGYDVVEGKLEVNTAEAVVVDDIYNWYVYKGWGYGRIAAYLNSLSIPAKKTKWAASTIKGILQNITYIGKNEWTPKIGEPVVTDGEHEAIVPKELFILAQTQLARRGSMEISRSSYSYPFSSVVKCGDCGASYTASYTRKDGESRSYANYRCANKKSGQCKASDIAGIKLTRLFFDYFNQDYTIITTETYEPEMSKAELRDIEKEKTRLEREIKKLENRKNNLLDDLGDKVISRDDYKRKVDEINATLIKLNNDLREIAPPEIEETVTQEEVMAFIRDLEDTWKYMDDEQRKFAIQTLFKRIVIQKDEDWRIIEVDPA